MVGESLERFSGFVIVLCLRGVQVVYISIPSYIFVDFLVRGSELNSFSFSFIVLQIIYVQDTS